MKETVHNRICTVGMKWPEPPLRIVLVEPEIPPNTGNIARLCAATGATLHLVGQLGFRMSNKHLRRAGLDYWDSVAIFRHTSFAEFLSETGFPRVFLFSTAGAISYLDAEYSPGDALVFGNERRGLPEELLDTHRQSALAIPLRADRVRSLNLANAAAIVLYEALRQIDNAGSDRA